MTVPAAARLGDDHTCPQSTPGTPPVPHKGGPISGPGASKVSIGGQPAAASGDTCVCVAPSMDKVQKGSLKVTFGGKAAIRQGDTTLHGGAITAGYSKVLIG